MINKHRCTYGPTKYSWAIENRLDEISNVRLRSRVKSRLDNLYNEFNLHFKDLNFIPVRSKSFYKNCLYEDFLRRTLEVKVLTLVDFGIRENFIKVLKEKIKE